MSNLKIEYKTVSQHASTIFIEKKSEFISNVMPVSNENEALDFLSQIRSKYSDATHNVFAYVLQENNLQRFSDDGEPSSTAGMPVLDSIRKRGLTDTIVVVTRYFGGTLLGTGGLVRAYGKCASEGVSAAKPVICRLCNIYSVTCGYTLSGKIQHTLANSDYVTEETVYSDIVTFNVCVKQGEDEAFIKEFTDVSSGSAEIIKISNKYINIPII